MCLVAVFGCCVWLLWLIARVCVSFVVIIFHQHNWNWHRCVFVKEKIRICVTKSIRVDTTLEVSLPTRGRGVFDRWTGSRPRDRRDSLFYRGTCTKPWYRWNVWEYCQIYAHSLGLAQKEKGAGSSYYAFFWLSVDGVFDVECRWCFRCCVSMLSVDVVVPSKRLSPRNYQRDQRGVINDEELQPQEE